MSSDTGSTGQSHIVVYTKSTRAGQTAPAALALTDVSKGISAVSLGDLDLDVNQGGSDMSWTPPMSDAYIKTYEMHLATDAVCADGALAGSKTVSTNGSCI